MIFASLAFALPLCLVQPLSCPGTVTEGREPIERIYVSADGTGQEDANAPPSEDAHIWVTSLEQFGVTWTFNRPVKAGRFANNDWWVVGPVELVSIWPGSVKQSNGRVMNGSMINPSPRLGLSQGYDSTTYGQYITPTSYMDSLNVALNVSEANPLQLTPNSSLVSTISDPQPGVRAQLERAAVLTVLPKVPAPGSFRPPYSGKNKKIRFTTADIDYSLFQRLDPVSRQAPVADVLRQLERPWLDHVPGWLSTYIHPADNMPNYGRDMADYVGVASLILNLNLPRSTTDPILIELLQIGIDFYGILNDGGENNWQSGGGHHSGRKWPILFAGMVFGNPTMSSIGFDPNLLFMGEDGQTFFVEETSPGVYNNGYGGYNAEHEGLPEWGNKHAISPSFDDVSWFSDPYRRCCTANSWTGIVLSAYVMDALELWNHPPLFEYQDRYVELQKQYGGSIATSFFTLDMWNEYRDHYSQ